MDNSGKERLADTLVPKIVDTQTPKIEFDE